MIYTRSYTRTFDISNDVLRDIFITAVEHAGYCPWWHKVLPFYDNTSYLEMMDAPELKATLLFENEDGGESQVLVNFDLLAVGLQKYIDNSSPMEKLNFDDASDFDVIEADNVLQYAIYGEIVFG